MNYTDVDEELSQKSCDWVREHKDELISVFCSLDEFPSYKNPFSIFMAGSPGAGKTEFATTFVEDERNKNNSMRIVHIDADLIKARIPWYNGKNSIDLHRASVIGIEKIHDFVLKKHQNFILDGTLSDYGIGKIDIERSLSRHRKVGIFYVYQDPVTSWGFTRIREKKEGRVVPKSVFINAFINSKKNVLLLKEHFGRDIELHLIKKDLETGLKKTYFNVDNVDSYIKEHYNAASLFEILEDRI